MKFFTFLFILVAILVITPLSASANTALLKEVSITPERAAAAKSQVFILEYKGKTWRAAPSEVRKWFKTKTTADGSTVLQLRPDGIYNYLNVHVSPRVNDLGEASRFAEVGGNLHLLHGGRKGAIVDGVSTSLAIRSALASGKSKVVVSMKPYRPAIFSAEDFKKLSFPHHLSHGETNFAGSPNNRVHNITVAAKRYDGLVLLPGEEFSFNQYLGEVDAANGYLPELVIKENVTTPEFGGGICQVSTTVFRAAMAAGLDITNRRNHSYPVAYYGTPGFDATVYAPTTDFKFKNDTGKAVYIRTKIVGTRLSFDIYGTSDGRTTKINGPFVTKKNPDGSQAAAVAQIVTRNGKTIREENFVSNYQSADKFPTVRAQNGE